MARGYLLKNTIEMRVETLEAVKGLHKDLLNDAAEVGYNLSSFSYTEKPIKESGCVVDSFFIVKAVQIFDEAKDPENHNPLNAVKFDFALLDFEDISDTVEE